MADQLSIPTRHLTLDEIGEDFASSYDLMIGELEAEGLDDAQLDDEAQHEPEFFPLIRMGDGSDPEWEAMPL